MIMRHHVAQWDAEFFHEDGSEFGGAIHGGTQIGTAIFAHFDTYREAVTRAVEIRVFALFVSWHVLDGLMVVHGEVPNEKPDAIAVAGLSGTQRAVFEGQRVLASIRRVVFRAVDGDVTRAHRAYHFTTKRPATHHVGLEVDLALQARQRHWPTRNSHRWDWHIRFALATRWANRTALAAGKRDQGEKQKSAACMHRRCGITDHMGRKWKCWHRVQGKQAVLADCVPRPYNRDVEPICFFNRHRHCLETEQVYGEAFLRWTYGNPLGALTLDALVKRRIFSEWFGRRMSTAASAARVAPFIARYGLDPAEFAHGPESFRSFNEFFSRKLHAGARPIDADASSVVFPADGRHLGFARASSIDGVFVKGQKFDLSQLLGDADLAARYANGALVLSRLCPVDYHRFHFPMAGVPGETRLIPGPLFSVSPIALRKRLSYLWTNKRAITPIVTRQCGTVLLLEIGATCVGTIQQTFTPGQAVEKGQEKGYFAFGGSSTLTLFEPGAVTLEADLLLHSSNLTELYAKVGTRMAHIA